MEILEKYIRMQNLFQSNGRSITQGVKFECGLIEQKDEE